MQKRKWTSNEKLKIVLEGLSGNIEIIKLLHKLQMNQIQYYNVNYLHQTNLPRSMI